ncbi:family 1 glycosylhydrolase [Spiroplasma endosymbiont of Poecilobothrus nobilitatus]|uniref:family 1 glycosylhydrolase n=1 Tax=Spiroplasma endosymbiont of Poecilobothrus nobilitatus TaxID=1209220 RepID=UPI00313EDBF9
MQTQWNTLISFKWAIKVFRQLKLKGEIVCILSISPSIPRSKNKADLEAEKWHDLFTINCFLDPMVKNAYPQELK